MLDKDYLHVFTTTTMDPFSITIPMLPLFSLSSTPRNVPRKRRNIEDQQCSELTLLPEPPELLSNPRHQSMNGMAVPFALPVHHCCLHHTVSDISIL